MFTLKSVTAAAKALGTSLALLLVLFSTISYIVSLALGPLLFFFTSDGLSIAAHRVKEVPIDFFIAFTVPIPLQISIGALFVAIWGIFLLCVIVAWLDRGGFLGSIKSALSRSLSFSKANYLFTMPLMATALLVASLIIQQFQETQGVQTGSLNFPPQTSPYVILLNLAFAPIREEFAFRITSIGIPVGIFLVYLFRHDQRMANWKERVKLILLALLSPEVAKAKMGYRNVEARGFLRGISVLEWVLILVTSVMFGAAHVLLGGGWEIGKVSTGFLAGLMLGITFVAYGAYASILLHWFFNYYFTVIDMAASTYGGAFNALSNLTDIANVGAGYIVMIVFLVFSAFKLADYLSKRAAGMPVGTQTST